MGHMFINYIVYSGFSPTSDVKNRFTFNFAVVIFIWIKPFSKFLNLIWLSKSFVMTQI